MLTPCEQINTHPESEHSRARGYFCSKGQKALYYTYVPLWKAEMKVVTVETVCRSYWALKHFFSSHKS